MSERNQELNSANRAWQATPDLVVLTIQEQAKAFYSDGRLERARELMEKVVKMRPEAAASWAFLGVIHRRKQKMVYALQCLQKAVELDPTDRNALVNLGESLVIAGKVEEGAEVLRALFDIGYVEGKPAADQDVFTRRAGAQLALLREVMEAAEAGELS